MNRILDYFNVDDPDRMIKAGGGWAALPQTDAFTGTENPLAGNWTTVVDLAAMQKDGGVAKGTTTNSAAYWNADSFSANQYSQVTNCGAGAGPGVRFSTVANTSYVVYNADPPQLWKTVAGTPTQIGIGNFSGNGVGNTIKLTANGTSLEIFINGVSAGSVTDSDIATGQAGIYAYDSGSSLDNWEGGNLIAAPVASIQATSSIVNTTATGNGTVDSDGGDNITETGIVVSSVNNPPTTADTKFATSPLDKTGAYTVSMTGLTASTKYYARAYIIADVAGTVYSSSTITFYTHPITYYFDAVSGDDDTGVPNDSDLPYKTITKLNALLGNSEIGDGDTFAFKRDTQTIGASSTQVFRGSITPLVGGQNNTITFTAYGAGSYPPVMDKVTATYSQVVGGGGWTDLTDGRYTIAETATSMRFYEDFVSLPPATGTALSDGRWYLDDANDLLYYKPLTGTPANHITERDAGTNEKSIYLWTSNFVRKIAVSNLLFTGKESGIYINGANVIPNNVSVSGCTFKNGATIYVTPGGIHNVTISNNTAANSYQNWITFQSSNNDVFDGVTISDNVAIGHNYYPGTTTVYSGLAGDPDVVYTQNLKNSTIEGNELSGYTGADLWAFAINCWISDAIPEACDGNICRNNYIHDVSNGIMWDEGGYTTDNHVDIYNNIITNVGFGSTSGYGIVGLSHQKTTDPSTIYNNTLYNVRIGICLRQADYWYVKNNIVHTSSDYYAAVESETNAHNSWDYNDYYDASAGNVMYYSGAQSFATWQGAGRDTSGLTSNPLFVNAGGSYALDTDFKIRFDSPCIGGQGTNVGLTSDYFGLNYVGDRYPIGASSGATTCNLTTYAKNAILDHVLMVTEYEPNASVFLGLFTADPTAAGSLDDEADYTGYDRQEITFAAATNKVIAQSPNTLEFPRATAGTNVLTYWAIIDAPYPGGNVLAYGPLDTARTVSPDTEPVQVSSGVTVAFTPGGVSTAYGNAILDWLFSDATLNQPVDLWMGLTFTDSTDAAAGTELSVLWGYIRREANDWNAASGGSSTNSTDTTFGQSTANWGTVTGVVIKDDMTAGTYMFYASTTKELTAKTGDYIRFPAGSISISL